MLAKAFLVVLLGIYAVRSTWFLFSDMLSPLTPVAMAVFVLCLFIFHRPPATAGLWFYAVIAACAVGVVANATLLFSTSPTYQNPTNQMFSMVSVACFIGLAVAQAWTVLGSPQAS